MKTFALAGRVGDAQCEAGDDLSIEELDARLPCELAAQPGSGQPKIVAYRVDRSTNDHGSLLSGHAPEVVHLDDFGKRSVLARQRLQGVLQFQHAHLPTAALGDNLDVCVPGNPAPGSATLRRAERARMIDEHLPHHPRHQREKMSAVDEQRFSSLE